MAIAQPASDVLVDHRTAHRAAAVAADVYAFNQPACQVGKRDRAQQVGNKRKVPRLLEQGGYAPLLDGRVRENVPWDNYCYYRELLERLCV